MEPLPGGLAGPLHLDPPTPWAWIFAALALVVFVWLWRLWRRRYRRRRPPRQEPVLLQGAAVSVGAEGEIDAIRQEAILSQDFRRGCHELASALRRFLERVEQKALAASTAREVAASVGERPMALILEQTADLQFRRRPPEKAEFEALCELSKEAVGVAFGGRRPRKGAV